MSSGVIQFLREQFSRGRRAVQQSLPTPTNIRREFGEVRQAVRPAVDYVNREVRQPIIRSMQPDQTQQRRQRTINLINRAITSPRLNFVDRASQNPIVRGVSDFGASALRSTPRATVSLINRGTFNPQTRAERFVLGNEPIIPAERSWAAQKTGIPALGVAATFAGVALDVTGGGKKQLAKALTKIDDIAKVRTLTKGMNLGEDVLNRIAKSKNADEIGGWLKSGAGKVGETQKAFVRAFDTASGQKTIANKGGVKFDLGEIGLNHQKRKLNENKFDRFNTDEVTSTLNNVKRVLRADNKPQNYRSQHLVWVAEMPNGESRAIYTRLNRFGNEEIISWHKINPSKKSNYIEQLESFGAPDQSRTGTSTLEGSWSNPLAYRGNSIVSQNQSLVKPPKVGGEVNLLDRQKPQLPNTLEQSTTKTPVGQPNTQPNNLLNRLDQNSSFGTNIPPEQQIVNNTKSILQGGQVKERGFVTTVKESGKTPTAVKDLVNGTYVVKSDTQRIADARNLIKSDPITAEKLALNPRNDNDITIGNQLIDHYLSTGQSEKVIQLTDAMAESGTELGRAIHAFADYDKTTPAGAVKFAQKTINEYNRANPNNKLALDNTMVKQLMDMAHKIQQLPQGRERNIASQELMNEVNNLIPSSFADKAVTVWKAGLLTSLRTTERNLLGNTVHGIAEVAKDIPAFLNDVFLKQKTGQRTLSLTTKGMIGGAKKGIQAGKDIITRGYDPEKTIEKFDIKRISWGKNSAEQGLKKYTDFVFNWMGAQDKPFYHSAFGRSLYDQAGAAAINAGKRGDSAFVKNLVDNPTEDMLKNATTDATKAVFQDKNALSNMINGLKNKAGNARWVTEIVAPFTGVPSSIAGQVIAYSPIGLAKGLIKDVKILSGKVPELQRQASQEVGRGVVGTGVMGIGALLAAKGLMTGQPKDAAEANQWQLEGKQANSIKIGGKWRSINSVGPEALIGLAGSKLQMSKDKLTAAGNIGKDFLSQTFLQGIQGPLNAITDPTRYAGSYLSGQIASTIPNLVKDVAKSLDPLQRESYVPKNIPLSIKNSLKSGIPLLRNSLLPKRDVLGNELKNEQNGYKAFVDLFNSKTPVDNPIVNELSRLFGANESATPSKLKPDQTINGKEINFKPEHLDLLENYTGQEVQKYWAEVMKDTEYQKLSDAEKSNKLGNFLSDIRAVGKIQVASASDLITLDEVKSAYDKLTAKQKSYFDTGNLNISLVKAPTKSKTTKVSTKKGRSSGGRKSSIIRNAAGLTPAQQRTLIKQLQPQAPKLTSIKLATNGGQNAGQLQRQKLVSLNLKGKGGRAIRLPRKRSGVPRGNNELWRSRRA